MNAFFRELVQTRIYKRTQGRIARQVTFAAIAVTVALGAWQLSDSVSWLDPTVPPSPASVILQFDDGVAASSATVAASRSVRAEPIEIEIEKGDRVFDVAEAFTSKAPELGLAGSFTKDRHLRLRTREASGSARIAMEVVDGKLAIVGLNADGVAMGESGLNFGFRFLIPGLVIAAGCWIAFRLVNLPVFTDFLIAVEAEMNKVTWPTRRELVRSSAVVLVMIFGLAAVLFGFDTVWNFFFQYIRVIQPSS